jgi:hypothetical protein
MKGQKYPCVHGPFFMIQEAKMPFDCFEKI